MNREEHLLVILGEECGEVIQEISKALRFGVDEQCVGNPRTNKERINYEFSQLLGVYEMLCEEGILSPISFDVIKEKKTKVEKWLEYSKNIGKLTNK